MKSFDVSYFDKSISRHANMQHMYISSNGRDYIFTAVAVILVLLATVDFAAAIVCYYYTMRKHFFSLKTLKKFKSNFNLV